MNNLATQVNAGNNFAYKYFEVQNDIDIDNDAWVPIGNNNYDTYYSTAAAATARRFGGTFDGGGYTLSGYKMYSITSHTDTYDGLFGYISTTGVVKNLKVNDYYINGTSTRSTGTKGGSHSGAIAGINSGAIAYVTVGTGTVTSTATLDTGNGGITGGMFEVNASICYSTSAATVTGTAGRCTAHGGITGSVSNGTILGCTFYSGGSVSGTNNKNYAYADGVYGYVFHGGIAGCSNALIINCTNNSSSISGTAAMNGTIVGYMHNGSDADTTSATSDTCLNVDKTRTGTYYSAVINCTSTTTTLKHIGYYQNDTGDSKVGIVVSSGITYTTQITNAWTSTTISTTYYDTFLADLIANGTYEFGGGLEIPEEYFIDETVGTELEESYDSSQETLYSTNEVNTGLTFTETAMVVMLIVGEFCGFAGLIIFVVAVVRHGVRRKKKLVSLPAEAGMPDDVALAVASVAQKEQEEAHICVESQQETYVDEERED